MIMKWNPIENGNLSGIPRDKRLLFTGIDHGKRYVDFGYIESRLENHGLASIGNLVSISDIKLPVEAKTVKAWMEIPEPFKPGRCNMCKHREEWTDNFGDRHSKCELFDNVPFSQIISSESCPIDKEISDDSN